MDKYKSSLITIRHALNDAFGLNIDEELNDIEELVESHSNNKAYSIPVPLMNQLIALLDVDGIGSKTTVHSILKDIVNETKKQTEM